MKNLIKVLVLALAVSSPLAVITPAVHAETTSTTQTAPLAKKNHKIHHKAAITQSKSQVKSGKHTKHLKHHKSHKHTTTNLTSKSHSAANKTQK